MSATALAAAAYLNIGSMKYPLEDRKKLVLFAHATQCFRYCVQACEYAEKHNLNLSDFQYKPISEWAVIEYGKPFKTSRGLGKVPCEIIPQGQTELHEFILRIRDKMIAHIDTKGLESEEHRFHKVRIEITQTGLNYIVETPRILPKELLQLKNLAKKLEEKSHYHVTKLIKKFSKKVSNIGIGEYLVDIEEPDGGFTKLTDAQKAKLYWD